MADRIQAVRGMNDILPQDAKRWRAVERVLIDILEQYGYEEVRCPVIEFVQVFERGVGEVTDIVEKEMYVFPDRNGEKLALRPEGTAGCVRMGIEQGLLYHASPKWWYLGPMFRYEKPQKGRSRQFHQLGVEVFGISGAAIEWELFMLTQRFWKALGLADKVSLEINTLGTSTERAAYKDALVAYLRQHFEALDADSQRRLNSNPLRILDSKNPTVHSLLQEAPRLWDSLGEESQTYFKTLCTGLDALGIAYQINPRLVRGLDYYNHTVFEWTTKELGSQGTICGGGRYDDLVAQLGGQSTPAVGFSIGLERLVLLAEQVKNEVSDSGSQIYFVLVPDAMIAAMQLADQLRELGYVVHVPSAGGSFKNQFKKADKSGAEIALVIGEQEWQEHSIGIKYLRREQAQVTLPKDQLLEFLHRELSCRHI
ncbi:MAG: histidine--tRNA ligase [Legionellaceae bacterium]|nr:histidine--tRNA ligase [Legionellaceae bacterium]